MIGEPRPVGPVSSHRRLVLIPSFNTGRLLLATVQAALQVWQPVWVVIDGSTDGSSRLLDPLLDPSLPDFAPGLKVIELPENRGKGGAVLEAIRMALHEGFSHALTMDADGQHPAASIPVFMAASEAQPYAMILGRPIFGDDAPAVRVKGRRISNWLANLETFDAGIGDSLFGFRVYPIAPLVQIMMGRRWMRRFDFDPEAAVRLCWNDVKPVNIDTPVRYLSAEEGGVSHFNYYRDNLLLSGMYSRLFGGYLVRLLLRLSRREQTRLPPAGSIAAPSKPAGS